MAYNFLACDRDQAFLLPPDLRDWLPANHLAWFLLDVVDQLDLDPFLTAYRADGHGGPRMRRECCWPCCCTPTDLRQKLPFATRDLLLVVAPRSTIDNNKCRVEMPQVR
jgi:hypothetical protein